MACVIMTAHVMPIGPGSGEVDIEEGIIEGLILIRALQQLYRFGLIG